MFRKVAIILIAVTFAFLGSIVQALMLIILLVLYLFYTVIRRPFNTRRLNELEIVSLISSSITIYCGIFFISSRDSLDPNFTPNFDCKAILTISNSDLREQMASGDNNLPG